MHNKLLAAVTTFLIAGQGIALEVLDDGTKTFAISGRIGVQTKTQDSKMNAYNDSACINFAFDHKLAEATSGFAVAEWGYKPHNEYVNKDGKTEVDGSLFSNRLGFLGIKNDVWGTVAVGKQDSVYSDVANWTDEYAIGGGETLGRSSGFTSDGGFSGTDRADDAVTYRVDVLDGLHLGAQYQMRGTNYDDKLSNVPHSSGDVKRKHGYQAAVSYTFDLGLSIGGAYNETSFEISPAYDTKKDLTSKASVAGIKFSKDDLYIAAGYGQFKNHTTAHKGWDAANAADVAPNMGLDKKSEGIEVYGRYRLSQLLDGNISLQTGWNQLTVKDDNEGNKSDAKVDKVMVGAIYEIGPMQFAAEYTSNKSKTAEANGQYKDSDNYFNLQARYYF